MTDPDVDPVAVARLISGDPPDVTTHTEKRAAVRILWDQGLTQRQIAERMRVCFRTVERIRGEIRHGDADEGGL